MQPVHQLPNFSPVKELKPTTHDFDCENIVIKYDKVINVWSLFLQN
jgi:hypothetical protein